MVLHCLHPIFSPAYFSVSYILARAPTDLVVKLHSCFPPCYPCPYAGLCTSKSPTVSCAAPSHSCTRAASTAGHRLHPRGMRCCIPAELLPASQEADKKKAGKKKAKTAPLPAPRLSSSKGSTVWW